MKLKIPKNSLYAVLLRSPWWVSLLVVAGFTLLSFALLPKDYVAFGVMGGLPFLVIGVLAARKQWQAPSAARVTEVLTQAAVMSWRDFSALVEQTYLQQGHAVARLNTPAADFKVVKGGRAMLVSCKRWKAANHGVEALRELVAAKDAADAQQCAYLSLGPVSDTAQRFAKAQGVTLLSGNDLARLLLQK